LAHNLLGALLCSQIEAEADADKWDGCDAWKADTAVQTQLSGQEVQCDVASIIEPNRVTTDFEARIGQVPASLEDLPYSGQGARVLGLHLLNSSLCGVCVCVCVCLKAGVIAHNTKDA